ncbi:2-methoxy-6-polyprenyl-1,4-benzoquinol methylase, mitochondrial [Protopterus annectens]|uniref:2-methoxy-6-polyprenyl-1,4-benzoquinol methylase, mitochondrial n=1 Tax=Protopterus annectens TaxID=7888 RepID=UPI001CF999F8|nr:2-methoxy-6-polyprenyl-1,4-benzoquinol methylase, mitochondrial [Protopterus annectens]
MSKALERSRKSAEALQEAFRVLKPGGRFLCLEFSHVNNPLISRLYDLYSFQVIPVLGELIAGDWKSYQYLVESIRRFPDQEEFKAMIEEAGFLKVNYINLSSGIVAIHSGFKL